MLLELECTTSSGRNYTRINININNYIYIITVIRYILTNLFAIKNTKTILEKEREREKEKEKQNYNGTKIVNINKYI